MYFPYITSNNLQKIHKVPREGRSVLCYAEKINVIYSDFLFIYEKISITGVDVIGRFQQLYTSTYIIHFFHINFDAMIKYNING